MGDPVVETSCTYPAMKGKHCGCHPNGGRCCACGYEKSLDVEESGRGKSSSPLTQQGVATPINTAKARAQADGNVAKPQFSPTAHRAEPSTSRPVDEIVAILYRRFKDWSKRGFGPDDVTWCEVKADVLQLIECQSVERRDIEAIYPAYELGDKLLRFDGSEWDRAIREYQGRIAELKDALLRGGVQP